MIDTKLKSCVSWIADVNIMYRGYQIFILCIINARVNYCVSGWHTVHFSQGPIGTNSAFFLQFENE